MKPKVTNIPFTEFIVLIIMLAVCIFGVYAAANSHPKTLESFEQDRKSDQVTEQLNKVHEVKTNGFTIRYHHVCLETHEYIVTKYGIVGYLHDDGRPYICNF